MRDWRAVEIALTEFLRREGFKIVEGGDKFAETSAAACQMAQIGETRCGGITARTINLTRLAKEIVG